MFGVKDSVPNSLCSLVVYKFSCAGCGACYVGESARHFSTRVSGAFIFRPQPPYRQTFEGFRVLPGFLFGGLLFHLRLGPYSFQLKIKEALRIEWERHSLNQQLKYFNLTLVVNVSLIITINLYFSIFFFRLV